MFTACLIMFAGFAAAAHYADVLAARSAAASVARARSRRACADAFLGSLVVGVNLR